MQGGNRYADHFISFFAIWFGNTFLPSLYSMACGEFRRDLEAYGLIKAFWLALTKESYD